VPDNDTQYVHYLLSVPTQSVIMSLCESEGLVAC